jgi:hypothetical protein
MPVVASVACRRLGVSAYVRATLHRLLARSPHTRLVGWYESNQQRDTACGLSLCLLQEHPMWSEKREGDQADNGCCGDEQGIAYLPPEQHDKAT